MTTTLPETWAWDDFDMLTIEEVANERREAAAATGAELLVRQRDKVHEALAMFTCDSVHLDDE